MKANYRDSNVFNNNAYTGRHAPGFRFCFHVRSISHSCLFLPLSMRELPQIQRLLKGESPLTVFNRHSLSTARVAFNELRKEFDFTYWAVKEYYVRDMKDADNIIPLRLNIPQSYMIDVMQKRYHNHLRARYVITKTFGRCGLTTCVQAYILWLQTYQRREHAYMCTSSDINLNPHKADLCRWLKRDVIPSEPYIFLPRSNRNAYFNTFRSPDFIRGIDLGYGHFADMSKWNSSDGRLTSRVTSAAISAVLLEYFTLVVHEGNIPDGRRFPIQRMNDFRLPLAERVWKLRPLSRNPLFLDYAARAAHPDNPADPHPLHIDLDDAWSRSRRLN